MYLFINFNFIIIFFAGKKKWGGGLLLNLEEPTIVRSLDY